MWSDHHRHFIPQIEIQGTSDGGQIEGDDGRGTVPRLAVERTCQSDTGPVHGTQVSEDKIQYPAYPEEEYRNAASYWLISRDVAGMDWHVGKVGSLSLRRSASCRASRDGRYRRLYFDGSPKGVADGTTYSRTHYLFSSSVVVDELGLDSGCRRDVRYRRHMRSDFALRSTAKSYQLDFPDEEY
jgi:hypothetical protein